MRWSHPMTYLLSATLLGGAVVYWIVEDKRHQWRAEESFVARCQGAGRSDCQALADANQLICWRLTYTPRGKAAPKARFDAEAHYRCVLDPAAYRRALAAKAKKRREQKRRHFIP